MLCLKGGWKQFLLTKGGQAYELRSREGSKITTILSLILRSFQRAFRNKWMNKIPEKTKRGAFRSGFLNYKRWKSLKENEKREYTVTALKWQTDN